MNRTLRFLGITLWFGQHIPVLLAPRRVDFVFYGASIGETFLGVLRSPDV
jgi:hypothetical protein